jgi:hypothetical protein
MYIKKLTPRKTQGRDVPSSWVRRRRCLIVVMSATSPHRPWPSCSLFPPREQLLTTAVGGPRTRPPFIVVVVAQLGVLGRCLSFCCRLPPIVVVVSVPISSPSHAAPCLHPASSCSQWQLAFIVLPQSTQQTVASSGSGGRCFSPSFSS